MPFVFYDTETTGTNILFDQILHFAAVLTDDKLQELDRFEARCRILPWIVPSPAALNVTGLTPAALIDTSLLSHFEMMALVHSKLASWSPALFIGYNSMEFDEPLLAHALWQTLHSPWLTIMDGNARLDLLPLVQAASHLAPRALKIPIDQKGRRRFKLDKLAPINGFAHENAHDALADVEATIHIAKILAERAPVLWQRVVARASRVELTAFLSSREPVLFVEYFGQPSNWFGVMISLNPNYSSARLVARLSADWPSFLNLDDQSLAKLLKQPPLPVLSVSTNKAPIVFSMEEARSNWGIEIDIKSRERAEFIASHPELIDRVVHLWLEAMNPWPRHPHLEQMLYDGFPNRDDQQKMLMFHQSDWGTRAKLMRAFDDLRLRQLSQRIIYADASEYLDPANKARLDAAIANRLLIANKDDTLWRSISDARRELTNIKVSESFKIAIDQYLTYVQMRFEPSLKP